MAIRKPAERPYTIRRGDDFNRLIKLRLTLVDDTIITDFTGYVFNFTVKENKCATAAILSLTNGSGINIDDVVNGNIIIQISDTITATLELGCVVYDLKWTDTAGNIETIQEGGIEVIRTIT